MIYMPLKHTIFMRLLPMKTGKWIVENFLRGMCFPYENLR